MPFTGASIESRAFKTIRELRNNVIASYGVPVVAVALAFFARAAINDGSFGPFTTYYPAIIISAFVGGLGPGVLALALSSLTAWFWFLPPEGSWVLGKEQIISLCVFALVGAVSVVVVQILNSAFMRVLTREHQLRLFIETALNGVIVVDGKGTIRFVNAIAEKLFGYSRSELVGRNIELLVPDRFVKAHSALRTSYMQTPQTRTMGVGRDLYARRKDGGEFPVEIGLNALDGVGEGVILATVLDISERKKLAEQQELLFRELHHRTQNLFAVIQSIANRTLLDDVGQKEQFVNRLHALAGAQTILADGAWKGARLDQLLRAELDAFTDRAVISGCDIVINPSAAQSFALIAHELATNASKYGALSVPTGNIVVSGEIQHDGATATFKLRWLEQNGPKVTEPERQGFGSTVLVKAVKAFGAQAQIEYAPDGLRYELSARLATIESRLASGPSTSNPPVQAQRGSKALEATI
jgi:PAS domain S-box-containing protein